MRQWRRVMDMVQAAVADEVSETWALYEDGRQVVAHELGVRRHKPIAMHKVKRESLDELHQYAAHLKVAAGRMYGQHGTRQIAACPCCAASLSGLSACLHVLGVPYVRCIQCGHVCVQLQPDKSVFEAECRDSDELAATYVDHASCQERIRQVVMPKLDWVRQVYARCYDTPLRSVVDVGAGGGHFVATAKREGMIASGYELSRASRAFARAAFDLELVDDDFLQVPPPQQPMDCVTFWGVLEYVPEPCTLLQAARRWLSPQGLVVLELPRYDCLGTAVLEAFPDTVYRHLEPTSHIHCFSDAAIASMLHASGYEPVAAWYFGMDVHELFMQMAMAMRDASVAEMFAGKISGMQKMLDYSHCCDDVIVAARPL